jgi:hypothetical protein
MTTDDDPRDERDEALDARLRAAFTLPEDVGGIARAAVREASEMPALRAEALPVPWLRRVAAAAAVLLASAGLWWWLDGDGGAIADDARPVAMGEAANVCGSIYADVARVVEQSSEAFGACQSPQSLAEFFDERYGTPLYVKIQPDRPVVGPIPCAILPDATVLGCVTESCAIAIVVGAAGDDPPAGLASDGTLHCYRRELGGLVLYELSPLDAPACLDLFYIGAP